MERGHEVVAAGGVAARVATAAEFAPHHGRAGAFPDGLVHIHDWLHQGDEPEIALPDALGVSNEIGCDGQLAVPSAARRA